MKGSRRLIYYLMLNVLVSACTTFAVLIFWDRTHPVSGGLIQFSFQAPTTPAPQAPLPVEDSPTPGPSPTPVYIAYQVKDGDTFDSIARVYGMTADQLMAENGFTSKTLGAGEVIRIRATPMPVQSASAVKIDSVIGPGDLATERVVLKYSGQNELLLAGWKLEDQDGNFYTFPDLTLFNGAVAVYTRSGNNTVVDLYWGLPNAVWKSGETVTLKDADGKVVDTYQVP